MRSEIDEAKRRREEDHKKVKGRGEALRQSRQGEAKESGKREDDQDKEKTIATRIGKVILTRRRDDCNKDRRSDIDEEKRRGEEDHKEVKR